jgi:hypothetical protein
MRSGHTERGDIVLGWLTKVTVVLAVLGVFAFDAISLAVGRLQTEDRGNNAARAAVTAYAGTQDVQHAYETALARIAESEPTDTVDPATFSVAQDGTVTLTIEHTAPTMLVDRIGPLRDLATFRVTVSNSPPR